MPHLPWRSLRLSLLALLACATSAIACQVPVFRFALERWAADKYEIVILHDAPLDTKSLSRLERLRASQPSIPANFIVRSAAVGETRDQRLSELWKQHAGSGEPIMAVLYPRNAQEVPDHLAFVTPFRDESIEHLADSPVRQEVAGKLLDGDSAVWIFVPSGHADQDEIAFKTLTEQVRLNQEELELPPQEEIEADEYFQAETNIELRLGFSIVTLSRDDPREQDLLKLLLGSEPDLEELDQPMAFPVLGRGRVLYALVGKGIARDTISMASRFIIGPCSCQVKEQNPGFDLLMAVDWDEKVGGVAASETFPQEPRQPILLQIPPGKASR